MFKNEVLFLAMRYKVSGEGILTDPQKISVINKWSVPLNVTEVSCCPLSESRSILQQCHDTRASGHLGVDKTLERVRERFYWTGLQQDVRNYALGYPQCRKRKNRAAGKSFMHLIKQDFLWNG